MSKQWVNDSIRLPNNDGHMPAKFVQASLGCTVLPSNKLPAGYSIYGILISHQRASRMKYD